MLGVVLTGSAAQELTQETQTAYGMAATVIEECLFAIRTVVAFGGEQRELARYGHAIELARKGGVNARVKTGIGMGYFMACWMAMNAVCFWFSAFFIAHDVQQLTVGDIM